MINSSNYTKILRSYDEFMEDWELYGFIREEENKYYLRNLAGEEGLAYDFNLNINDTLEINNPFGFIPIEVTVINIDSVFIEPANEYRKRITLFEYANFGYEEQWIEGIGSLAGLTQSGWDMTMLTGGDDYTLLCYYEDSVINFKTELYSLCFYPIVPGLANIQEEEAINLYPNPVINSSYLEINNPKRQNFTIRIFNSTGSLVKEYQATSQTKIEIHSSNYKKGIYFYQVIENNQQIFNSKFIVL